MEQTLISCSFLFTIIVLCTLQESQEFILDQRHDEIQLLNLRKSNQDHKSENLQNIKLKPVEKPLHIGSFNVQTLGKKKLSDDFIMVNLEKVIHRYDLILITELMTNDQRLIARFLNDVNKFAPEGVSYNITMNNDTVTNEYCVFFYRTDKLRVVKVDSYRDPEKFYRTPFFVLFDSPTLRDMKSFGVIGFHVKPDKAVREIDALANVYDFMSNKYKIEDILLMGDFNAHCTYVKEDDWENISLWTRPEFTWPIGHNVDTTTNYKSCALDRFVYAGENMNSGVIMSSARSLNLQEEFGITLKEARALSDHKPIELKIRGKMSDISEKHLTSESCFTIKDSRRPNVTKSDAIKVAKTAYYTLKNHTSGIIVMKNTTKYYDEMIGALKTLRTVMPATFTHEQLEAIMYKLEHGALDDRSSYADEQNVIFKIDYTLESSHSNILICKTSTIN